MLDLRILQRLADGEIGRAGHAMLLERRHAFLDRERPGPGLELVDELPPVHAPVLVPLEARVGQPVAPAGRRRHVLEGALAGGRQHDIAVPGLDRPVHRPRRRLEIELRAVDLAQQHADQGLEHRHIDHLALAGGVALVQRRQDGAHRIGAAGIVGDEDSAIVRPRAALLVGGMRHVVAGRGMDHRRIGGTARRRPGLAVTRDAAVDEPGIDLGQLGIVEAQPLHHARPVVLDDDVDDRDQLPDGGDRLGLLEIEHDRALPGIELAEHRAGAVALHRPAAHQVALGRFDLDDLGAHVGHQAAAMRAGNGGREVEHANAVQRPRAGFRHFCTRSFIELVTGRPG